MKVTPIIPPRSFTAGRTNVTLTDCARIHLDADEQVTFVTESGAEYDLARKRWGYYATPSTNGRLAASGLRAVLVRNAADRYYVLLVERGCEAEFDRYIRDERQTVIAWLDNDEDCRVIERALRAGRER